MEIRTKYDIWDTLYFLHEGVIRNCHVERISCGQVNENTESGEPNFVTIIVYHFKLRATDKNTVSKLQSEVFKRRADLIKSLQ